MRWPTSRCFKEPNEIVSSIERVQNLPRNHSHALGCRALILENWTNYAAITDLCLTNGAFRLKERNESSSHATAGGAGTFTLVVYGPVCVPNICHEVITCMRLLHVCSSVSLRQKNGRSEWQMQPPRGHMQNTYWSLT
eukprot:6173052-Pleurochrysis_carterae.AAC.2